MPSPTAPRVYRRLPRDHPAGRPGSGTSTSAPNWLHGVHQVHACPAWPASASPLSGHRGYRSTATRHRRRPSPRPPRTVRSQPVHLGRRLRQQFPDGLWIPGTPHSGRSPRRRHRTALEAHPALRDGRGRLWPRPGPRPAQLVTQVGQKRWPGSNRAPPRRASRQRSAAIPRRTWSPRPLGRAALLDVTDYNNLRTLSSTQRVRPSGCVSDVVCEPQERPLGEGHAMTDTAKVPRNTEGWGLRLLDGGR